MRKGLVYILIGVLAVFAGCDGGGDGGGGGGAKKINIGDDSKPVSDFTPAEAKAACEEVTSTMDSIGGSQGMRHLQCILGGLLAKTLAGDDAEACQIVYDACMDEEDDPGEGDDNCDQVSEVLETCELTTGELEACFNAMISEQQDSIDALADVDCATSSEDLEALQALAGGDGMPPECEVVDEKCPDLMGGGG